MAVLENRRAWFGEHGYLTARSGKAVTQGVNALCAVLRPRARTLVDGFGIPETWLDCPLLDGERDSAAPATNPAPASEEPSGLTSVG